MTMDSMDNTVIKALVRSLCVLAKTNSSDIAPPCVVLWTDHNSQWQPIIAHIRQLLPQFLTFGGYIPEHRSGPAIWLRSVIDRALVEIEISKDATPIVYLPGVSRQDLHAAQDCPDRLKPLVELQYRGICWTQKNGTDWTVEAFLVSKEGGLGLNVSHDRATRRAMRNALPKLAVTAVGELKDKHLEAEDFNKLFSDDPAKDILMWLNNPDAVKSKWDGDRWVAFKSRCKADFKFDPDKDGELVGAERLGKRAGSWATVWKRFAESPRLYEKVPELLRKAKPVGLCVESSSSWPQNNEEKEAELRQKLFGIKNLTLTKARGCILELERIHGSRREWVWEKLGHAPLTNALEHLVRLVEASRNKLGGASINEMAKLYADTFWEVDAAALSAAEVVKSAADAQVISNVLDAVYRPWLESAAEHLQYLTNKEPLPRHDEQPQEDLFVKPGGVVLFTDGLRFDVSQRLVARMRDEGWIVTLSTRWAGLPTVTATAKPAVSPVIKEIKGTSLGEDFVPVTVNGERPLTADRFRKLLKLCGYKYFTAKETGDPNGRGWTEGGKFDKLGHSLEEKLAGQIEEQIELLLERIKDLFEAGWREIRVMTDHGWLWLPGGLPKVDLPKYLTASRWARCASIKGESKVDVPTVFWHWSAHERVALAPGIGCFNVGKKYAHGGLSLQESLVPIIHVTPGKTSDPVLTINEIIWTGLRCRIRVQVHQQGLSVDLRTDVNDVDSSVSQPCILNAQGSASLLVVDDKFEEGSSVEMVVLNTDGHVIAKKSTTIGGYD